MSLFADLKILQIQREVSLFTHSWNVIIIQTVEFLKKKNHYIYLKYLWTFKNICLYDNVINDSIFPMNILLTLYEKILQ